LYELNPEESIFKMQEQKTKNRVQSGAYCVFFHAKARRRKAGWTQESSFKVQERGTRVFFYQEFIFHK